MDFIDTLNNWLICSYRFTRGFTRGSLTVEELMRKSLSHSNLFLYHHRLVSQRQKNAYLGTDHQKSYGGGEFLSRRNFLSLSNSLYEIFFRPQLEYFLGLIGVHEFFSFNFPWREYFFCTSPASLPHKFSNGPSRNILRQRQI